jgi:hypothetical protein
VIVPQLGENGRSPRTDVLFGQDRLDRCQLRDFQVISRYIDLVAVAYGLLRAAAHAETLLHKVQHELKLDLEDSVKAECTRCLLWAHPSNALIWLANS